MRQEQPELTGVRWSLARSCPRMAAYHAMHAPARRRTENEERILFRGQRVGQDYIDWLEMHFGYEPGTILREVEIAWGGGVGHMDGYDPVRRAAIEVLSTVRVTMPQVRSKCVQLAGYMLHYPAALHGYVAVVDPADLETEEYWIGPDHAGWDELVEEVRWRSEAIKRWAETDELPERVCQKPADGRHHNCQHIDHCFTGWQDPGLEQLSNGTAELITRDLYRAKGLEVQAKRIYEEHQAKRKGLEELLADWVAPGDWQVGDFRVLRTEVHRRPTINARAVEHSGFPIPEEFLRPGAEYSTWKVVRLTESIDDLLEDE